MANTYTPQTWTDGVSALSAARMGVIETGVQGAWARELAYNEITSNVAVTATTSATANTIVTASAVTFDGSTAVVIEFYCVGLFHSAAGNDITTVLYDGAASIGNIDLQRAHDTANLGSKRLTRRITPSSASHTYSIRAYTSAGTATFQAGAGGATVNVPAFIRIERA